MLEQSCYFGLASVFDGDALHLREEVVGIPASFSPHTRVLHSSKWQVQISHQPAVGPHQPRLYPPGNPVNPGNIPGPHGGAQAVAHAVGLGDGLVLCVKWVDAGDGAEDLLLHDSGTVRDARNDGGRHKIAAGVALGEVQFVHPFAAVDDAAFRFGESHKAADLRRDTNSREMSAGVRFVL